MPKRKALNVRSHGSVTQCEIEELRAVIRQGHPWVHYLPGREYCPSALNTRLDILLRRLRARCGSGRRISSKQTNRRARAIRFE